MVIKCSNPINNMAGVISYHHKKLEKGDCKLHFSSCDETKKDEIINHFNEVHSKNDKVKNEGLDIVFSFKGKEDMLFLENNTPDELIADYLERMGFDGQPYNIYEHADTDNIHYHVTISNVNYLGENNKVLNTLYKKLSNDIRKDLTSDYHLFLAENTPNKHKNISLNELNMKSYSFQKGLLKAIKENAIDERRMKLVNPILQMLKDESITNEYMSFLLGSNFKVIDEFLLNNDYIKTPYKSKIISELDKVLRTGPSSINYQKQLKNNGLYVRFVKDINGFVYGIDTPGGKRYFNENKLPERFRFKSFQEVDKVFIDVKKQKDYISKTIGKELKKANNLDELILNLKLKGVGVDLVRNTKSTYGINFYTLKAENINVFKGSDVNRKYSWQNINKTLSSNQELLDNENNLPPIQLDNAEQEFNPKPNLHLPKLKNQKRDKDEDVGITHDTKKTKKKKFKR